MSSTGCRARTDSFGAARLLPTRSLRSPAVPGRTSKPAFTTMNPVLSAEDQVRAGDPAQALQLLQDRVRAKPGDAKLRIFLFQLLCVLGQWQRALNQLNVAAEL